MSQRDKQAEEDDKIRGEATFWQLKGTGAAEALSKGLIPAQASPAFLRAYKRLEGEVAGGEIEQKFSAAYDTWEGKTSTDPKAYDAFVGTFMRKLRGDAAFVALLRAERLDAMPAGLDDRVSRGAA